MDTTSQNNTITDTNQSVTVLIDYERPTLDLKARDFLLAEGWDALFSWVRNNAPEDVFCVLRSTNYLEYIYRSSIDHDGMIPKEENQMVFPVVVVELLNALARLERI